MIIRSLEYRVLCGINRSEYLRVTFMIEKGIMYIKVSRIGLNATLIGGFLWIEEAGV